MKTSPSLKRLVFLRQMAAGGMPNDCRKLISIADNLCRGEIALLVTGAPVEGVPVDKEGPLEDIDVKTDIDGKGKLGVFIKGVSNSDFAMFFKFSRLVDVASVRRLHKQSCHYSVRRTWQINELLDWDRPFSKPLIPTIESAKRNPFDFNTWADDGVVGGKVTIRSRFMAVERKVFRASFNRNLLQNDSFINFFSDITVEAEAAQGADICF